MKKIIFLIMITGFLMAQWVAVNPKPPTEMRQLNINMNYWHEQAYGDTLVPHETIPDSFLVATNVLLPDSFNIAYDVNYRIFMYNEDGQLVRADITQGDLLQYMTNDEKIWMKEFLDKYGALSVGLIP